MPSAGLNKTPGMNYISAKVNGKQRPGMMPTHPQPQHPTQGDVLLLDHRGPGLLLPARTRTRNEHCVLATLPSRLCTIMHAAIAPDAAARARHARERRARALSRS